jgi:hypothetical protein
MDTLAQKKTSKKYMSKHQRRLKLMTRFPFALIYKIEDDGSKAVLVDSTDNTEDHSEIQKEINLEKPGINSTNVAKAVAENRLIESVK